MNIKDLDRVEKLSKEYFTLCAMVKSVTGYSHIGGMVTSITLVLPLLFDMEGTDTHYTYELPLDVFRDVVTKERDKIAEQLHMYGVSTK